MLAAIQQNLPVIPPWMPAGAPPSAGVGEAARSGGPQPAALLVSSATRPKEEVAGVWGRRTPAAGCAADELCP